MHVYTLVGNAWTLQTKLVPRDAEAYSYFGHRVAINGDTLVVVAWGDDGKGIMWVCLCVHSRRQCLVSTGQACT